MECTCTTGGEVNAARFASIIGVAVLACTTRGWPQRENFREQLRCGQQQADVKAIADRTGGTGWICGTQNECNFTAGKNRVLLGFDNGGLRTVEDGEQFGLTGVASWPRLDVCSGQQFRRFVITAPTTAWVGAAINVDGTEVARVRYRNDSVYLPLGQHTLRIEKSGREPIVREMDVPGGQVREAPEINLP
jgi:hypothetical protein